MAVIKYKDLEARIVRLKTGPVPPVCLIHGDTHLVRQACDTFCASVSETWKGNLAIESLDGTRVGVPDIIDELTTFSFFSAHKLVVVKNIPLFHGSSLSEGGQPISSDHLDLLANCLDHKIPEDHGLVLTCVESDKRKKLYKRIDQTGLIIDCSVAQGIRKADLDEQNQVLKDLADAALKKENKTLGPQVFQHLVEWIGFNPELFAGNLEKLITYTGTQKVITLDDVKAVVVRDKKNPVFHFTNALMDKDATAALFFFNGLLADGFHLLQILKSLENQIRKLLAAKCFLVQKLSASRTTIRQMGFNGFKQQLLPQIVSYDTHEIMAAVEQAAQVIEQENSKKKKKGTSDLLLAPQPNNAYPVFQLCLKSEHFSLAELTQAVMVLADLDYQMKHSAIDAKTQIESFIIRLCQKGGFANEDTEYKNHRHHF